MQLFKKLIFLPICLSLGILACSSGSGGGDPVDPDPGPKPPPITNPPPVRSDPDLDPPPPPDDHTDSTTTDDEPDIVTDDTTEPDEEPPADDAPDKKKIPRDEPEILSFTVSESCVLPGSTVTLSWETRHADDVWLWGWLWPQRVSSSGTIDIVANYEWTYRLAAVNDQGSIQRRASVYLRQQRTETEIDTTPFSYGDIDQVQISDDGVLLILSEGRIYKGSDSGNFLRRNPNQAVSQWSAIAIDPEDSSTLYAATTGRVYRSTNGGSSWPDVIAIRRNGDDLDIHTLFVSRDNSDRVFIGVEGTAFRLNTQASDLDHLVDLNTESIRHFVDDEDFVVAATPSELFVSPNNGSDWDPMDSENWGTIHDLDIHNGNLYVSTAHGLYRGLLSNPSWDKLEGIPEPVYDSLVIREGSSNVLYAATTDGIYRSLSITHPSWSRVSSEETHWVLNDGEMLGVTEDEWVTVDEVTSYTDHCPNQPLFISIPVFIANYY